MIFAQISDMHVRDDGQLCYGRVETSAFLARAVDHLVRMRPRPDLVFATGDLVDKGTREEYRRLRHLLAPLPMPVHLLVGNHDDRDALRAEFEDHRYLPRDGFLHYVVDDHPVRFVALDTLVPGQGGGHLCDERLGWLAARLAEAPTRPTVIVMHHPPFVTGIPRMDALGLAGAEAMGEIVRRHPQVEAVLCGHLHRAIQVRWYGTVASTAPSTAHQVDLDFIGVRPSSFTMEPPACQVHLWRPGTGVVSHTSYIGDYGGPLPFRSPGAPL